VRLVVVLPCFNEEGTLDSIVRSLRQAVESRRDVQATLLLIDDGSFDATWALIQSLHREFPYFVSGIRLPQNRGKAVAQATGIRVACERADLVAVMDADGQHAPADLLGMVNAIVSRNKPQIGVRQDYKRRSLSGIGAAGLALTCRLLGIEYDSRLAEFFVVTASQGRRLSSSPWFGIAPIVPLLVSQSADFGRQPVIIGPRLSGDSESRWPLSTLIQKGLLHVFLDPWNLVFRASIIVLAMILSLGTYGLVVGVTSVINGSFLGIGSIIVSLTAMFMIVAVLLVCILGLVATQLGRINLTAGAGGESSVGLDHDL